MKNVVRKLFNTYGTFFFVNGTLKKKYFKSKTIISMKLMDNTYKIHGNVILQFIGLHGTFFFL